MPEPRGTEILKEAIDKLKVRGYWWLGQVKVTGIMKQLKATEEQVL